LDLGCSHGRFSFMMAAQFPAGQVTACDLSAPAIEAARAGATARDLRNVEFNERSIEAQLALCEPESMGLVMMTEVTFFYPEWPSQMASIDRALRPGGVLVMSFRSQYFNALTLVRDRKFIEIELLLQQRRGRIFPPSLVEFSWQTSTDVRTLSRGSNWNW
jgi:2-polyprenyl-3-methyl-5-hydroxy-6-metoxy-1,4-benzoquinol methylase